MKLKVPYFRQTKNYTRGASSAKMLFKYFGITKYEKNLVRELKTNKMNGTSQQALIDLITKNKLFCYTNNNSNLDEIRDFLEKKLPVIVNYIEPENNEGHFAIITGLHKNNVILNDPWHGRNFKIPFDDFESRWKSENGYHNKWILVASLENLGVGRQFLPR